MNPLTTPVDHVNADQVHATDSSLCKGRLGGISRRQKSPSVPFFQQGRVYRRNIRGSPMLNPIQLIAIGSMLASALALAVDGGRESLSGGLFTTLVQDASAYRQTIVFPDEKRRLHFLDGFDSLAQKWVMPFLPTGVWGRGPLSNAESCLGCHLNSGRGAAPAKSNQPMRSMITRVSLPGKDATGGPIPHPRYGHQINFLGVEGDVYGEGEVFIKWQDLPIAFADGETRTLRAPTLSIEQLGYGALTDGVLVSPRITQPLIGLGLLEAIPDSTLEALARAAKPHGIKGKTNRVWDLAAKRPAIGRFGLKASHPHLSQQIMAAFHEDMGVTSNLFPVENCTEIQKSCRHAFSAPQPELGPNQFTPLLFYVRANAVPARRNVDDPVVKHGAMLFQAACSVCHVPELKTGDYAPIPEISNQVIRPYTDLLLHDMGDALADHRPDFEATGSEWRTPPLWGLGLAKTVNGHTDLLHDGRARGTTEAILWHAGEASFSRDAFLKMPKQDRQALLQFLDSL